MDSLLEATISGAHAQRRRARSPSCDSTLLPRDAGAGLRLAAPPLESHVDECRSLRPAYASCALPRQCADCACVGIRCSREYGSRKSHRFHHRNRRATRCRDPKSLLRALFAVINANCFAGTQSSISPMAVRGLEIYRYDPQASANGGRPDSGPRSCRRADLEGLCGKHVAQWSKNPSTMLVPYRYSRLRETCNFTRGVGPENGTRCRPTLNCQGRPCYRRRHSCSCS
jgi:hypothetical protein